MIVQYKIEIIISIYFLRFNYNMQTIEMDELSPQIDKLSLQNTESSIINHIRPILTHSNVSKLIILYILTFLVIVFGSLTLFSGLMMYMYLDERLVAPITYIFFGITILSGLTMYITAIKIAFTLK
jgi:hypothetical protein